MLLDYVATYQILKIRFHACDMHLKVNSDAAYLVQPQARSRYAGFFYLGSTQPTHYILNGAVLITCKTIGSVRASAAEVKTTGIFHNAQHVTNSMWVLIMVVMYDDIVC